jgi:iron complex outermembrane receptor protein
MVRATRVLFSSAYAIASVWFLWNEPVLAQSAADAMQEVVVTATKKEHAENVQDVPLAVTAFGSKQLEALNFQNLTSLSYAIPNVQLENVRTTAATANFSIRGLGINSSIPSIDPTVGVFVDGVYMGINAGVLFDNFDIDSIEILRGPQGVLFGRNVTGGAVLLRTKAPGNTFEMTGRVGGETGPNYIADATISGPIVQGILSGKLALYHDDDKGWLKNKFDNSRFGKAKQTIVRPVLRWTPTSELDLTLRLEHGQATGDGPAGQNHALFSRNSFDFAIDEPGFTDSKWNQAFLEGNLAVAFGEGKITNIFGWRKYESTAAGDIDSTPVFAFHAQFATNQDQRSEELRYAGTFGPAEVTTGVYYFQQNILYIERRLLAGGAVDRTGGGDGDFSTWGAFAANDWSLSRSLKLNVGLRFTHEAKDASVATVRAGGGSVVTRSIVPDFIDSHSWNDVSPRVGFQWIPAEHSQIYAYWAKGFRSGGYNFRNTDPGVRPGPFDSEHQSSFELGLKQDFAGGLARVNLAAFHNKIKGSQREINTPGALGVTQIITNVGDATIKGAELEGRLRVTQDLVLSLQAGYTHGQYDSVKFDLNGDGVVNAADAALQLPRLAPWSYGAGVLYDLRIAAAGVLSSRVGFNHRDANFYTDNNRGRLNKANILDANLTYTPARGPASFAVYGTNLLNEVTFGGDTQLPDAPAFGGDGPAGPRPPPTFSPLNKGRVVGAEVRIRF